VRSRSLLVEEDQGGRDKGADRQDLVGSPEVEDPETASAPNTPGLPPGPSARTCLSQLQLHATPSWGLVEDPEDVESAQEDPDDEEHHSREHPAPEHVDDPGDDENHATTQSTGTVAEARSGNRLASTLTSLSRESRLVDPSRHAGRRGPLPQHRPNSVR